MNGSQHYREGERLLSQALMFTRDDGPLVDPEQSAALAALATAHFAAAQAAATALEPVTHFVGDSDEITAWARITGLFPPRDGVRSRACEFENHRTCAGCGCGCHEPAHTCVPFDPAEERRAVCQQCRDEAAKGSAA